jgi:hypothetical protein
MRSEILRRIIEEEKKEVEVTTDIRTLIEM